MLIIETPLYNGRLACPGDEIIFRCETRGSLTIAWRSAEFIGPGGRQLQFANVESSPKSLNGTEDTVATLIDTRDEDGIPVLVSINASQLLCDVYSYWEWYKQYYQVSSYW